VERLTADVPVGSGDAGPAAAGHPDPGLSRGTIGRRNTRIAETAGLLLDFSHSRQALLSVAQPALGALLAGQRYPDRRTLALGLPAATAGMLCVYASNDLFDLRADREEARWLPSAQGEERYDIDVMRIRHPLAQGALSTPVGVAWVSGTGLVALALATKLRRGCGLIFVGCVVLEAIYCALRRRTWLKTVPGGSMVGLGALAGWYAMGELDKDAFMFFLLLTFWEIFGRNISNDLADLSLDDRVGIRTLASTHGPKWAARTCLGVTAAMLVIAAMQRGPLPLRLMLSATVASTMTIPAAELARRPDSRQSQRYFNRASLFPPLAFVVTAIFLLLRRPGRPA